MVADGPAQGVLLGGMDEEQNIMGDVWRWTILKQIIPFR